MVQTDDSELERGSFMNQVRSRHGDFAKRCGEHAEKRQAFAHMSAADRAAIGEAVRLAILDGALRELELR